MPPKAKKKNSNCKPKPNPKNPAGRNKKSKASGGDDETLLQQMEARRAEDEQKKAAEAEAVAQKAAEAADKEIIMYRAAPEYIEDPSAEQLDDAADAKIDATDLASQGMIDPQAIDRMTDALGIKSGCAACWAYRALLYLRASKQHCAMKDAERALELDPDSAAALNVAGKVHFGLGQWRQAVDKLTRANRIEHDKDTAMLAAHAEKLASTHPVANATRSAVAQWLVVGNEGGGTVNGRKYSEPECYIKALEIDGSHAPAWCNLGSACGGGTVNGRKYSKTQCFIETLELDPSDVIAWCNIGIGGGGTVNGRKYSKPECYIKALELDGSNSQAWYNFGCSGGGKVNGRQYSEPECYIKALEIDGSHAPAWCNLGSACGGGTVNGRTFTKEECFIKALDHDRYDASDASHALAWYYLGKSGGATVNSRTFTKEECFAQAQALGLTWHGK